MAFLVDVAGANYMQLSLAELYVRLMVHKGVGKGETMRLVCSLFTLERAPPLVLSLLNFMHTVYPRHASLLKPKHPSSSTFLSKMEDVYWTLSSESLTTKKLQAFYLPDKLRRTMIYSFIALSWRHLFNVHA